MTSTSYTVQVSAGNTYYWKVVARDRKGGESESQIWNFPIEQIKTNESIPDNVDDTKEQIVSKYNPSFDWSTQTPSRNDVLQAVVNAVIAYFSAQDDAAKQNILSDVVQMVILYFSLRS